MNRYNLVVFTFLLLPVLGWGQQFIPGYYLTLEKDTIRGLIQDNGLIRNSHVCVFKPDAEADTDQLNANDILAFHIRNQTYHARSLELFGKNQEQIEDVFIRYIVRGKLSLLTFYDRSGKQRYYLEDKEHGVSELYQTTRDIDDRRFTDKRYQGVFRFFTEDCAQDLGLDNLTMKESNLAGTVIAYNECVGASDYVEYQQPKLGFQLEIMPQVGMHYHSPLKFTAVSNVQVLYEEQPDLEALDNREILPSFQPTAGVNILVSSERQPNFLFLTGAHYNPIVWESSDGVERFAFEMLEIPFMVQYRFTPRRLTRVVPFLQVGAVAPLQLSHSNTNDGVFNIIELEVIDEETNEVERNKVGETELIRDDVTFQQLLKFGAGMHIQLNGSQLLTQFNFGFQSEAGLGDHLIGESNVNLEFRLGWIPGW